MKQRMSTPANSPTPPRPTVFISYSWTTAAHQEMVKGWAKRLFQNGVRVVLDKFDLKPGQDMNAFMERMVVDSTITHVLVICDRAYTEKANERKAGVGTETQIIASAVYKHVDQTRIIPILAEVDEQGRRFVPVFLSSRLAIDFSTPEAVDKNWDELIRALFDVPLDAKPELGPAPAFVREPASAGTPAAMKFATLRRAVEAGSKALGPIRQEFLNACIAQADALRVRSAPDRATLGDRIVADFGQLTVVRNHIIDWVLLEAPLTGEAGFQKALLEFLDRLLVVKARPRELQGFQRDWFDAHVVFVYETFLYIVAALIKSGGLSVLHDVLTSNYLQPEGTVAHRQGDFVSITCFWGYTEVPTLVTPQGQRLLSPAAELIKLHAKRPDLAFESVIEAELVVLLMACVLPSVQHWFPATLIYGANLEFPIFVQAARHRGFEKLAAITGINSADRLRAAVEEGRKRLGVDSWNNIWWRYGGLSEMLKLSQWDTIK
jgi:hypothetical protein